MDKRRAFVALILAMAGPSVAHGEDHYDRGAIAVTFHENGVNRLKSESFYVVQQKGQVRWQNYQERDYKDKRVQKVFEVKEGSSLQRVAKSHYEPAALASVINK